MLATYNVLVGRGEVQAIHWFNRSQSLCAFFFCFFCTLCLAMASHLIQQDQRRSGLEFGAQTKT